MWHRGELETKGLLSTSRASSGLPISVLERGMLYSHKVPRDEGYTRLHQRALQSDDSAI